MSNPRTNHRYQGVEVRIRNEQCSVCLTDLWQIHGCPADQGPSDWIKLSATQDMLGRVASQAGVTPSWSQVEELGQDTGKPVVVAVPGVLETTTERGVLCTYASSELAIIYARSLSIACYEWALTALADRVEQEGASTIEPAAADADGERLLRRRALITAGWAIPTLLAVTLAAEKAYGHADAPPRSGNPHYDVPIGV